MASSTILLAAALVSLPGSEWGPERPGDPELFVRFEESRVAGHGGCNRFFGPYEQNGARLRIGPLAVTRMACPAAVMEAERRFLRMLERTRRVDAGPGRVVLWSVDGVRLGALRRRDRD